MFYVFIKSEISLSIFLQLVSIITDETPIEQMRNRLMIKDRSASSSSSSSSSTFSQLPHQPPHTRKPKLALLREVFGRGIYLNKNLVTVLTLIIFFIHIVFKCPLFSSLQVPCFAGFFLSNPALHQLVASHTLPCPTMTSDSSQLHTNKATEVFGR